MKLQWRSYSYSGSAVLKNCSTQNRSLKIRSTKKPQYSKTAVLKAAVLKNHSTQKPQSQKPQNSKTAELKNRSTQIPQFCKYDCGKKKL